jgi:hypothetical protein
MYFVGLILSAIGKSAFGGNGLTMNGLIVKDSPSMDGCFLKVFKQTKYDSDI